MATYNFEGYPPNAIHFPFGGSRFPEDGTAIGVQFRIDPGFDASSDRYQYEVTETSGGDNFSGDPGADEVGEDADQFGTVRDADGTIVGGGPSELIYLEHGYTVEAPDGGTINFYTVEIDGQDMGLIADEPLQPGVTYEVVNQFDIDNIGPEYSVFGSVTYDPDDENDIDGGPNDDDIASGPQDDSVDGGRGDDFVRGNSGDDTLKGGAGDDYVLGGGGNDEIFGDPDGLNRLGFKWFELPSPNDPENEIEDEEIVGSGSLDVNGVTVSFTYSGTGTNDGFEDSINYVAGIDAGDDAAEAESSWQFGSAHSETSELEIELSAAVENVAFRINDIDTSSDVQDQVTVRAFDASGNPIALTISVGTNVTASDSDAVSGNETGTGSASQNPEDEGGSMLVEIPGPVSRIVINHVDLNSSGGGAGLVTVTDIFFDDPSADGNDTLDGGSGNDVITTGGGFDKIVFSDGDGSDVITDFDMGDENGDGYTDDQLDLSGLTDVHGNPVNVHDVVIADDGSGNALLTFPNGESILLQGVSPAQVTDAAALNSMGVPCFTRGTLIRTSSGNVPVEHLKVNDLVVTRDNGLKPIRWIGRRSLGAELLRDNPGLLPVLIQPGAFENEHGLLVSPQHGVLLRDPGPSGGERFVRATHLTRLPGTRTRIAKGKREVTYLHILFDQHEVVLSNGLWTESFFPGKWGFSALGASQKRELLQLFPDLGRKDSGTAFGCTARVFSRFENLRSCTHPKRGFSIPCM